MTHANDERRPAAGTADLPGSRAASKRNHRKGTTRSTVAGSADSLVPTRLEWAAGLIDRATGPVPRYGTREWELLDDRDPAKVAATVIAAESWRTYWSPEEHERRLRAEFEVEEPPTWSPEIVAQVHRSANRPSYAELSERRGEPEAAARGRAQQRRLGLAPVG